MKRSKIKRILMEISLDILLGKIRHGKRKDGFAIVDDHILGGLGKGRSENRLCVGRASPFSTRSRDNWRRNAGFLVGMRRRRIRSRRVALLLFLAEFLSQLDFSLEEAHEVRERKN